MVALLGSGTSFTPETRAFCHHSPHLYSKTRKHTPTLWTSVRQESHDQLPQLPRLPGHLMSIFSFSSLFVPSLRHIFKKICLFSCLDASHRHHPPPQHAPTPLPEREPIETNFLLKRDTTWKCWETDGMVLREKNSVQ